MITRIFCCICLFSSLIFAHPHVFIDATADLIFDGNGFVGVQNKWSFDLLYSQAMIAAGDKNQNGKLEPDEFGLYQEQVVDAAKEYSRFNYIGDGTNFYSPKESKDLKVSVNGEGKLVVEFLNVFDVPSNPEDYTMLVLAVTDPTNYIQITIDMEKSEVKAPESMDVEYFVDALDGLTQFNSFSRTSKGLYVRFQKAQ